jgi:hypothetical protein
MRGWHGSLHQLSEGGLETQGSTLDMADRTWLQGYPADTQKRKGRLASPIDKLADGATYLNYQTAD